MSLSPETLPIISHILHNKSWQNFTLKELSSFISQCYTAGLSLQSDNDLEQTYSTPDCSIDKDEWLDIYQELEQILPFKHNYANSSPFETNQHDTEEFDSCGLLTDIIVDLSEGARIFEHSQTEALFHWQMTFEISWGEKSLILLRALHQYIIDESL